MAGLSTPCPAATSPTDAMTDAGVAAVATETNDVTTAASRVLLDDGHVPFVVTAHVPHGVATNGTWGIALDGLLAGQIYTRWKHSQLDTGRDVSRARDLTHPDDLDLPLSRCLPTPTSEITDATDATDATSEDLWHWACTTAMPTNGHDLLDDVRYWIGRLDERATGHMTADLPGIVSPHRGRYRERKLPLLATSCSHLTWRGIGDPDAVAELLEPITCIGRRRCAGEGRVLSWTVEPLPAPQPPQAHDSVLWAFAHTHPDGALGRPSPASCLTTGHALTGAPVPHAGLGVAGIRPPLAHPARQHTLYWPTQLTDTDLTDTGPDGTDPGGTGGEALAS